MTDYSMIGKTYRYFKGETIYPFGYGLSYSKFKYSGLTMQRTIEAGQNIYGSVTVHNVGNYDADEVSQIVFCFFVSLFLCFFLAFFLKPTEVLYGSKLR